MDPIELAKEVLRQIAAGHKPAGGEGVRLVSDETIKAASAQYPLGPPTVANESITVHQSLKEPTRITRFIRDITLQRFLLPYLFRNGGGVNGGAVVYDLPTANDLYLDRDLQQVAPGAEFPLVMSGELVPTVATVEKWGAKTFITWEARDRNDQSRLNMEMRRMGNTLVRKLNQRAVETVENILTSYPAQVVPGNDWTAVTTLGTTPTDYSDQPIGDLVNIWLKNETDELGMSHDTLLINPTQQARLQLIYGDAWRAVLSAYGYNTVFASNRITVGTAYSIASGQLGELRFEQPLRTDTWEDKDGKQIDWMQISVRPLMYVQDPFAVIKLTGLGT